MLPKVLEKIGERSLNYLDAKPYGVALMVGIATIGSAFFSATVYPNHTERDRNAIRSSVFINRNWHGRHFAFKYGF